jgi:hypothetical protein
VISESTMLTDPCPGANAMRGSRLGTHDVRFARLNEQVSVLAEQADRAFTAGRV